MGDYPFRAKMILPIEKPQVGLFLKNKGIYPYIENAVAGPAGNAMPYAWLEPEIRAAFNRTFSDGSKNPERRTSPRTGGRFCISVSSDFRPAAIIRSTNMAIISAVVRGVKFRAKLDARCCVWRNSDRFFGRLHITNPIHIPTLDTFEAFLCRTVNSCG